MHVLTVSACLTIDLTCICLQWCGRCMATCSTKCSTTCTCSSLCTIAEYSVPENDSKNI